MTPESKIDDGPPPETPASAPVGPPARWIDWRRVGPVQVVALAAVALAIGWSFAPNIASLVRTWNREPDYSHGFLVIPIALVILWKTWPADPKWAPRPWWPAWGMVAAALAARYQFHERGQTWSESATLLPVVAGLGLAGLGWRTFAKTWPAYAFLVFLLPLPPQVNSSLSQPLQSLATTCSCALLRLTGLWVMPEGNVILVGNERLEVAAACNGLSMLMSLAATVAATASLVPMAAYKRAVLLLSIIPIALGSNVLRIAATAWCYHRFGSVIGSNYAHDWAGWLMMPMAMVLVGLELALMSWLIVESEEHVQRGEGMFRVASSMPLAPKGQS